MLTKGIYSAVCTSRGRVILRADLHYGPVSNFELTVEGAERLGESLVRAARQERAFIEGENPREGRDR